MNDKLELLVVMVPIELKDSVVDALMSVKSLSGFNIKPIQGFSRKHAEFNSKEKVQGYMDFAQFEILIDQETKQGVFEVLKPVCSPVRAKYWQVPVLSSGHFMSA